MINLLILAEEIGHRASDAGDRALKSNKTGYVFCGLAAAAASVVLALECGRAIFS